MKADTEVARRDRVLRKAGGTHAEPAFETEAVAFANDFHSSDRIWTRIVEVEDERRGDATTVLLVRSSPSHICSDIGNPQPVEIVVAGLGDLESRLRGIVLLVRLRDVVRGIRMAANSVVTCGQVHSESGLRELFQCSGSRARARRTRVPIPVELARRSDE
jgi:hypothetical protein